jgi:uncharacterized protein (TIGR03435 family)
MNFHHASMIVLMLGYTMVQGLVSVREFRPAFEVASIKPNKSVQVEGSRNNLAQKTDSITIIKYTLRMLMGIAYELPTFDEAVNRILGLQAWADSEYFDIEARAAGSTDSAQKRLMLQSLLADRFKLVMHRETRQRPVFALVLLQAGKFGAQLHVHADDSGCDAAGSGSTSATSPAAAAIAQLHRFPCGRVVGGLLPYDQNQAWSGGRGVSMEMIASSLAGDEPFDRPIIDGTADHRLFDFTIEWHTLLQPLSTVPSADNAGITLVEALRDQLGLKLVGQRGPVDVLVVEHAQRPTPN